MRVRLAPKNWASFQHYKDRAPPWIKLHKSLLNDFEFSRLPLASKALAPLLWVLASEYENGSIDASLDEIAFRIHVTREELEAGIGPLIENGFFISDGVPEHVASKPLADCAHVAINVVQSATPEREKRRGREETDSRPKPVECAPSRFEEFWKSYPRRLGDNPRKPAEEKFNRLVKTGVDPAVMIEAVKAMALTKAADVGTQFIPQAVTWLNQQRWIDHAAVAFEKPPDLNIEDQVERFSRGLPWSSKWYGPEPGHSGCKASSEVLAKYGLLPDGRKMATN